MRRHIHPKPWNYAHPHPKGLADVEHLVGSRRAVFDRITSVVQLAHSLAISVDHSGLSQAEWD